MLFLHSNHFRKRLKTLPQYDCDMRARLVIVRQKTFERKLDHVQGKKQKSKASK